MAVSSAFNTDLSSQFWIQGFQPQSFSSTTITYSQGTARSLANGWAIEVAQEPGFPASFTIDTSVQGAGGIFPGNLTSITPGSGLAFAPVAALGDASGKNTPSMCILTAGALPEGYNTVAIVGFALVNNTGNLVPYTMGGNYNRRNVMLKDAIQVLNAGNDTTYTVLNLSSLAQVVPGSQNCVDVDLLYSYTPTAAGSTLDLVPTGLTVSATPPIRVKSNTAAVEIIGNFVMNVGNSGSDSAVSYKTSNAGDAVDLYVSGFTMDLPLFLN